MFKHLDSINSIGYFGSIDKHINLNLLVKLADSGININLYGKNYLSDNVISHKRIRFHGYFSNSNEMFEKILEENDATIIPYLGNMDGVIPAKMLQSLALLRPVFISSFFDSNVLSDMCYVYESENQLLELIRSFNYEDYKSVRLDKIEAFVKQNLEETFNNKIKALFQSI
jgi:hypothetical protein